MKTKDTVQFGNRSIGNKGGSPSVSIPPELMEYLELEMGSPVIMIGQTGKHGKYLALWKKE